MQQPVIDWHGLKTEEIAKNLDRVILEALIHQWNTVEIIAGKGKNRKEIIKLCKEQYDYDAHIKYGNDGVVVIEIE